MKHLFSTEGEKALADVMALQPLLAFDFDGTLAPIVTRPEAARVSTAVARRLQAMAAQLPVAIVSGRRVDDVRARLGFAPHFIIGNHGAEDPEAPTVESIVSALDLLRQQLQTQGTLLGAAEVTVEDKHYSIALHYRLAHDRTRAEGAIAQVLQGAEQYLHIFGGKLVVNVMSKAAPDKADAVWRLVHRNKSLAAVFVGDDVNDEPVFARAQPDWLTVKVGREDPHSKARFYLDNAQEVGLMLDRMVALMGLPPAPAPGNP